MFCPKRPRKLVVGCAAAASSVNPEIVQRCSQGTTAPTPAIILVTTPILSYSSQSLRSRHQFFTALRNREQPTNTVHLATTRGVTRSSNLVSLICTHSFCNTIANVPPGDTLSCARAHGPLSATPKNNQRRAAPRCAPSSYLIHRRAKRPFLTPS